MLPTKKNIKELLLQELENTKFPICRSRGNVATSCEAMALGEVCYRGQKALNFKTRGESRWNKKFPELYLLARRYIELYHPDFKYTTIQLNKNVKCTPHIDKNNCGESYVIALGDFAGGRIVIEGKPCNIRGRWKKFNGKEQGHWTEEWEGTRYSLVYFCHTFKPPPRDTHGIKVTEYGIFRRDGSLIKSYTRVN